MDSKTSNSSKKNTLEDIKTSDLARYILKQNSPDEIPNAPKDHLIFGKIFEEVYTEFTWLNSKNSSGIDSNSFRRKLAAKVNSSDISDDRTGEFVSKGYKMFACLLNEGVKGRKPKSQYRDVQNGSKSVRIYAQPDLKNGNKYFEFKTGSIDKYAEIQSQIFSWVIQQPVTLVGLSEGDNGYVDAEKKKINGCGIDIEEMAIEYVESDSYQ